jgi:aspartyl-tRNA(Asn)/glutamyl-tRNA(Gln) amidotransferase subunit A
MVNDDALYMTVEELAPQIRAKKISPVELAEGYLDRLEKFGARLGANAAITRERALQEARAAEKEIRAGKYRGPLHGIPYGVKDLLAARGYPTTWGAPPFKDQAFDFDSTVVARLRDAGAVLVAKLAMIELAGGGGYSGAKASLQGPSRCPYNLDYWAGGSSSGPGAATPAALVGFSIGSETLGSIITPCAFSGVSGLRPTYGRVSRFGAMALSWTMDKLGPMCRSAADCGLVLAAIAGPDANDPSAHADGAFKYVAPARRGASASKPLAGKRLALLQPNWERGGDKEIGAAFTVALDVLRQLGATIEEFELPDYPYGTVATLLYTAEAASIFRPFIESGKFQELVDEQQKIGLAAALSIPATDYLDACRLRGEIQRDLAKTFDKFDAWVAPSRNGPANLVDRDFGAPPTAPGIAPGKSEAPQKAEAPPKSEQPAKAGAPATPPPGGGDRRNVIGASNVAGLPAISVPCGFTSRNLPAGIQFVADALRDDLCIELARAYQSVTDWHRKRPSL